MGAFQPSRKNYFRAEGVVPGLKIQLELNVGNRTELYASQVEDIDGERLGVLVPIIRLQRRPLPSGSVVRVSFVHNRRRRRFVTEVVGHSQNGMVDYLQLPPRVEDSDRRQAFRLDANLKPRHLYRLVIEAREHAESQDGNDSDEASLTDDAAALPGVVVDISEGGVCLSTRAIVSRGERLGLVVDLPEAGELQAHLQVTGVEEPSRERLNRKVHCKFTGLTRRERDLVARFLMRRQLELRRRGQL